MRNSTKTSKRQRDDKMDRQHMHVLLQITDIVQTYMEKIVGIQSDENHYSLITHYYDPLCEDELDKVCADNGLQYEVLSHPSINTNGKYNSIKEHKFSDEKHYVEIRITKG